MEWGQKRITPHAPTRPPVVTVRERRAKFTVEEVFEAVRRFASLSVCVEKDRERGVVRFDTPDLADPDSVARFFELASHVVFEEMQGRPRLFGDSEPPQIWFGSVGLEVAGRHQTPGMDGRVLVRLVRLDSGRGITACVLMQQALRLALAYADRYGFVLVK